MMRRFASAVFVAMVTMLAAAPPAGAQGAPPPPKREGSAEFAAVTTSGNTSTQSLGLAGDVTFRPEKWVYRAKSAYVQNKVAGLTAARSFTASFRGSRMLTAKASLFGQVAFLRDRFSGIDSRTAVEAGVANSWEKGRQSISVDGSAGYAKEQRLIGADLSTGVGSAGTRYKVKLSETADFTDEFRYTQSFSTSTDYRVDHVAAITAKLTTLLSLKASNTVRYVNAPVPGFKTTDTITSMALVAKF